MLIKNHILPNSNFFFMLIKNQKVLNYNNLLYLTIPESFSINFINNNLQLLCINDSLKDKFLNFNLLLSRWLKRTYKLYNKKLILKGLGIRANISSNLQTLELKLGFSHLVYVSIPKKFLTVKLLKNTISVTGFCPVMVANFLYRIRSYKIPNSYKGKGLWYKNEIRTLKLVKKS